MQQSNTNFKRKINFSKKFQNSFRKDYDIDEKDFHDTCSLKKTYLENCGKFAQKMATEKS
ncbi:hypothetical protein T01_4795 [Trichinella spiralis]|uniref:Uncharacterized protein n=1 Tax=Trichinella spiralis TaxID=6334 RepID=A0A0V1BP28_TRISP|nr:hypothetical protein T01_4795 [Trichinella spiralis]